MSFGQLSLWRDVEKIPPESRHQINIRRVIELPPGVPEPALRDAFNLLRSRHESLRTRYSFADPRLPQQIVSADTPVDIPSAVVPSGVDPAKFAEDLADSLTAQPIDVSQDESWRATIVIADGQPTHVVLVLHHIAVDLWAVDLLRDEFTAVLEGRPLPIADASPRTLAMAQHSSAWQSRRDAASAHLRHVYTTAASASTGPPDLMPATSARCNLRSRVALPSAEAHASSLGISLPSLVLASYCYAAHSLTGAPDLLVNAMTTNRLFPGTARLVSSMNQWSRLLSHHLPSFEEFARATHWHSLRASRHGCYNVDTEATIRHEVETTIAPIHPEFSFNFVQTPSPAPTSGPDIEFSKLPHVVGGPAFYLVATQSSTLDLAARTRWPHFTESTMERFLTTMHDLILG
jgi:hypothetical protein